ncbi:MAG: LicD family protein [Lachnospiraceae bacterium]|nr:LicD family protein [Lachnospiraceae bacterium]
MQLSELHDHMFELLCLVDDICKKENVRYFLVAGSELGAVREKNFIPWDDDVDIMVLREDYDAFKDAMQKHLSDRYIYLEPSDVAPKFYDFASRVIDKEVVIRRETEDDKFYDAYRNNLCIDVFTFEMGTDNKLAQKMHLIKCKCLYGMAMSKRVKIDYEKRGLVEKISVFSCSLIGRMFSMNKILKMWDRLTQKYSHKKSLYRFSANAMPRDMIFYDSDIYEDVVYFPIRDREFPVPVGYDKELTMHYGDYMKPREDHEYFTQHLYEE